MTGGSNHEYHEVETAPAVEGVCLLHWSHWPLRLEGDARWATMLDARGLCRTTNLYRARTLFFVPSIQHFHSHFFFPMLTRFIILLHVDLPPPPKRRRGLAGSIVSTALNAALIGTAVGLTVYRL